MKMRIIERIIRGSIISMLLIPCPIVGFCVSPLLNNPRVGDMLKVQVLQEAPHWVDSMQLYPDLSRTKVSKIEEMSVIDTETNDSVPGIGIVVDRRFKVLEEWDGELFETLEINPGVQRMFEPHLTYGIMETYPKASNYETGSCGMVENQTRFFTSGTGSVRITDGLVLIATAADTLHDVSRVDILSVDTIAYFDIGKANLRRSQHSQWYAPGYRYPVLSTEADTLLAIDEDGKPGEIIDIINAWSMISPEEQETNVLIDPLNERLRELAADEKLANQPKNELIEEEKSHSRDSSMPAWLRYADNGHSFEVSHDVSTPTINAVLLCDINGRVYETHKLNDRHNSARLDISSLAPGVYLVCVLTDSGVLDHRFRL